MLLENIYKIKEDKVKNCPSCGKRTTKLRITKEGKIKCKKC